MNQHINGKAVTVRTTFRMENAVSIKINASPEKIWKLLTNVAGYTGWNSTIVNISGNIVLGGKVNLVSKLDPKRTFKLKVVEFQPAKKLVWKDGFAPMFQGVRTYELTPASDGSTFFSMSEVLSGLMLPLIAKSLPDFKPNFEQIALDLKRAAESNY